MNRSHVFAAVLGLTTVLALPSLVAAQSLPSCDSLVQGCIDECHSRGAVNKCPAACRRKVVRSPNGERAMLWGEHADNGRSFTKNPSSDYRVQRCR